jgi:hypothetical protein
MYGFENLERILFLCQAAAGKGDTFPTSALFGWERSPGSPPGADSDASSLTMTWRPDAGETISNNEYY